MRKIVLFILMLFSTTFVDVVAQTLRVASIFTNNMVLQQDQDNLVWGYGKPGTRVTVSATWMNAQDASCTVSKEGKWKLNLHTPSYGGPYILTVTSGTETVQLQNVYVGEVWLAGGQSNMSMPLKGYYGQPVEGSTEAILSSLKRKIHYVNIPTLAAYRPLDDFEAQWIEARPDNAAECSAVAWYFAAFLNDYLDIPIGIINVSYSGSNLEAWMTPSACNRFSDIEVPAKSDETSPWISNVPTVLYNGMLHPVVGYGIKGFIFYQGESNVFNVPRYAPAFAAMVEEWRKEWKQGELPFYYAQIAPYNYKEWNFYTPQWPEISAYQREAQQKSLDLIPNSGMAVLLDVGEEYLIHPCRKQTVGNRLGLLALHKTYGLSGFESESPRYSKMEVDGNKAIIHFDGIFHGITSFGRPITLFEIAGDNHVFLKADAYIDQDKGTVVVSSKYVSEPKAVRYAWKDYVEAELFGTGGLPISSFRTDDWK